MSTGFGRAGPCSIGRQASKFYQLSELNFGHVNNNNAKFILENGSLLIKFKIIADNNYI